MEIIERDWLIHILEVLWYHEKSKDFDAVIFWGDKFGYMKGGRKEEIASITL